jgi:hypothetical protein
VPVLSHLTSCIHLHLIYTSLILWLLSLSGPGLYRLLTFQVPNLSSIFRCSGYTKVSVQVRGFLCQYFVIIYALRRGVTSPSPNLQARGQPLFGCLRLLILYIRSYTPYWRPFLHPKPKDAPYRGNRDLLFTKFCYLGKFWD